MTFDVRLDHVSLHVRDLARSAAFYAEALGLQEIENKTGRPHIRWFALGPRHGLHLISGAVAAPERRPLSTHFAVATDAFEVALRRLSEHGVQFGDLTGPNGEANVRADGARQIYFQDPDGHWIEINDGS
jgi:lactoylglutathione lyase